MDEIFLKNAIQGIVSEFSEIRLIYLFGSQISGITGPMSDIDLGVLLTYNCEAQSIQLELIHRLAIALDRNKIDVVILNKAPIELAYAVIAQGHVLYQHDQATRVEFEARVLSLYGDYLPVLRAQQTEILKGGPNATRVQRYRETLRRTERTIGEIRSSKK